MPLVGVRWTGDEGIGIYQGGVDKNFFHRIYPFVIESIHNRRLGWRASI